MMRSMFSGISGLKVHQTKMDVIANNISNVNTVGFKSSRVTFNEFFSQNISPATMPNDELGRGGINAKQIGLGVGLGSIDVNMTSGTAQRTDRAFDLSISGEGFFIVGDKNQNFFTRAGALSFDKSGNIVVNTGQKLKGWEMEEDPKNPGSYIPIKDRVKPIEIKGSKTYAPPTVTRDISMSGNLNAIDNPEHASTLSFYDSLGNRYVVDTKLSYDDTNKTWAYQLGDIAYLNGDKDKGYQVSHTTPDFSIDGLVTPVPDVINYTSYGDVKFLADGLIDPTSLTELDIKVTNGGLPFDSTFGQSGAINVDLSTLTGFNQIADAYATTLNGNTSGNLTNMSIAQDGTLVGQYSNGEIRPLYKVPVATFVNPSGLEKVGNNLFKASLNSGDFDEIGRDVGSLGGSILSGTLEMSNVDISGEFTEMITTQRGFQANSRTITTSDEMLQELVNLKR